MTEQEKRKAAAAIFSAAANGEQIEWHEDGRRWVDTDPFLESFGNRKNVFNYPDAYRIKPKPRTRPWNRPHDVPWSVCWIRPLGETGGLAWMILSTFAKGIHYSGRQTALEWDELARNYEYSTDKKSWHRCEVTED